MSIKIISASFLLSLIVFASCSGVKVNDSINGGFEREYNGENPDGWFANNLPQMKKYAELIIDNSTSHSGNKSILISVRNTSSETSFLFNWIRRVDGLKPSGIYELEGWIKTFSVRNSPFIEVQCRDVRENKITGTASTIQNYSITGTKDWTQVKLIFKTPKNSSKVLIIAGMNGKSNNGSKVWFDDIQIRNVE